MEVVRLAKLSLPGFQLLDCLMLSVIREKGDVSSKNLFCFGILNLYSDILLMSQKEGRQSQGVREMISVEITAGQEKEVQKNWKHLPLA